MSRKSEILAEGQMMTMTTEDCDRREELSAAPTITDPIDLEEAARYLAAYIREHAVPPFNR